MFQRHFGLERDPFSISPDPAFLYPSEQHRQALAHLKYGLQREGGFILLTGEVGTGKTTLTRLLLEQAPANFRIAYILNARLGVEDLLASICQELDVTQLGADAGHREMVDQLYRNLLQAHEQGRRTLVVIEEAQNLSAEVLETLRLLTNLETNTAKLLHILLVGQPELLETLKQPSLRQLDQRVISRHHLQPLRAVEVGSYVVHRMKAAGSARTIFKSSAIHELWSQSRGIPRKINLVAECALMGAYAGDLDQVGRKQVRQAAREVLGDTPRAKAGMLSALRLASLTLLIGVGVCYLVLAPDGQQVSQQLAPAVSVPEPQAPVIEEIPAESAARQPLPVQPAPVADSPQPLAAAPHADPRQSSAFSQLLAQWSVEAAAGSVTELCRLAAAHQLRCVELAGQTEADALRLNRPFLVVSSADGASLVKDISAAQVSSWPADILFLWRPPVGYDSYIATGDRNSAVLSWLMPQLASVLQDVPNLITGGHYSQPVAELVADFQQREGLLADGVLGRNTLMRLNELSDEPVPTLGGGDN